MKKLLCFVLSCAVVLSSFFIFDITSLGSEEISIDDFSADVAGLISEFGIEPESAKADSPDFYNAGVCSESGFETCRIIVKSEKKVDPLNAVAVVSGFEDLWIMQFETPQDAQAAYDYYVTLDFIEFAEPDKIIEISSTETEDYPYAYKTKYISWGPEYIGFGELNDYIVENELELAPVTVAVIDTGIRHSRPEFEGRIEDSCFNNSGSGETDDTTDENGHGTHVASVIADCTFSNVIIRPYKVFNSSGKSTSVLISNAIFKACDDKCEIINMSFGQPDENHMVNSAVEYATETTNPLMVAAIGNEKTNDESVLPSPAVSEHVIAVSSINKQGKLSSFSNYSKKHVELTAPGERIYGASKNNDYALVSKNGTSQATPFVACVAAAVKSLNPTLSTQDIRALLASSAIPMFTDREKKGFFGNGLVYAMCALEATDSVQAASAPVFSHESGKYDNPIQISITAQDGAQIYYTTDGTIPTENSNLYTEKITVDSECGILAAAYVDGKAKSSVSAAHYRIPKTLDSSLMEVDDNGCIISYSGDFSDIVIPETAVSTSGKTVTVKGIGEGVFENNLFLLSVKLPETVTEIKSKAFYGCENLEEINLSALNAIGDSAFYMCRLLNKIDIPNVNTVGSYAFYNIGSVNCKPFSINSESFASIGEGAFASTPITYFYAPNASGGIGDYAFENCVNLIEVYFPNADNIGKNAFAGCVKLNDVAFNKALTVGDGAFLNCENIKSISLESAQSIGHEAFHGCVSLAAFSLPSAKTIYSDCFKDSPETLTALVLPSLETIVEVEESSFPASLTSFYAPKLKNVPSNAFKRNTLLSKVTLGSAESIGDHAFYYCASLKEIDLSSVKSIGDYAFYSCSGLTEVDLSSLQTLGEYGFNNCSKLKAFDMPELLKMGAYSIYGTKINYLSAPKATTVSQNALVIDGYSKPLIIDLSSLKKITLYNFLSNHVGCFVFNSLEEGNFYAGGPVYYPTSSAATCSRKRETAPRIFTTDDAYGYSHMPESASVPDVLFVSAAGLNLTYQWYSNTSASQNGATLINGATSPKLDLMTVPDAPYYFCKVTMTDGSASSTVCSTFVRNASYLGGAQRADYSKVFSALEMIPEDLSIYTEESVAALNALTADINYNLPVSQQASVDSLAAKITAACNALTPKDAVYSAVEAELLKVPEDLSIYTPESASAVEYAVQSITYGLDITSQLRVDCMALRLADKLSRLEIASADYSKLDALLGSIPNLENYTEESIAALEEIIDSIDRNLKITDQDKIEEYIKAVEKAVAELEPKNENYLRLEEIIKSVPEDLSNYTNSSVSQLRNLLEEIENGKSSADSQQIDEYINLLNEALNGLKLKPADYSVLDSALEAVPEDLSIYTDESVAALNSAIADVDESLDITQQSKVEDYAQAIANAVDALQIKKSDLTSLNNALALIPSDLSVYTEESVEALENILGSIDYERTETDQDYADECAQKIADTVEKLELEHWFIRLIRAIIRFFKNIFSC